MANTPTAAADWVLILPLVLALMGAAVLLMVRRVRGVQAAFAGLIVLAMAAYEAELFFRVLQTGPVAMTMGNWLPPFGISFVADVLGAGLALTASLVTLVILVYAQMDREGVDDSDGFYPLVLLLLAGVTGALLTGDLFNLYVWFEVMLIASFGLMVLSGREGVLDGAVKYGFINFLATTFFLAGLGLLYGTLGTLNMADITLNAPGANPAVMAGIAALFLLAFGIKAAAFPVNAWLPASYHTPPAVISALFAGLLTKVGVYALLRTMVALLPESWSVLSPVITAVVILTLLIAPLGAIAETNLRRALGFVVIGGIGAAMAGLALPTVLGVAGSVFYLFHAMVTMTALYLVAGLIERVSGHTDTRQMGGLYASHSLISILFFVLILAAAGVPPLLGFWPKLLLLQGAVEVSGLWGAGDIDYVAIGVAGALLVNAFLTLIAGTRLWSHIFWRAGTEGARSELPNDSLRPLSRHERNFGLTGAAVLTLLIVISGLLPGLLLDAARVAASDLLQPARAIAAVGLGGAP